jgi:cytochrome P450
VPVAETQNTYPSCQSIVAIHQWAVYHLEKHFKDPFKYHPERFLDDLEYAGDNKDVFWPFHMGPRNCLGRK